MTTQRRFVSAGLLLLLGACGSGSADSGTGESASTNPETSDATSTSTNSETSDETTTSTQPETTDDGDLPGFTECDMFAQDCPDGEKCVPFAENGPSWDNAKCVPVTGAGAPGEPCTTDGIVAANDDCDATSFCFGYDQDNAGGRCHPFCTGDITMPECIDGWVCSVPAQGPSVCVQECDPLADNCGAGSECVWTGSLFTCIDEGEAAAAGEACMFVNDCASGLLCANSQAVDGCADDGCCTPFCSLMAGDGPCQMLNPAHSCEPFFMRAPIGYEDVGACVLAP
ncbi:hypothetical protein [Enhygromyxa salina]|nr:hypothetical protein [Enhygromyxa salina]